MITTTDLTKSYKNKDVLTGVTFHLEQGGIHGLLGRNGVGKSTLLGILAGQIKADGGTAEVMGYAPFDNAELMDEVVLAGVDTPYPAAWSAQAILQAAALRYPRWDEQGANRLAGDFALEGMLDTKYSALSRGQKAMLGIIVGLASGAPLTLLDEPYVGLDTHNRRVFYQHLLEMSNSGRTFIMATHHIHESAKVLDSFIVLGRDGKVARHVDVADVADEYVLASAPDLDEVPGALAFRRSPELDRALIPRADAANLPGARLENADLDDIIDAMLEES
ncbi:ATP-binding cassette domain-containing protein [Corynebacterium cystitidis]|uniref:ATP-binding cassette domain-containing protein n=1 Tax=Corynebacterium cystitidis TaxID=35757 RepID=UPI00211F454E|nr:ABC transporter ATP-binding protein [Corynebacterium cystitidis]